MDGGGFDNSGKGSSDKKNARDNHSIMPLTIKQVLESEKNIAEDNWSVDGQVIYQVKLVATIVSKEEHTTNVNYVVNDGTAGIECKKWIDGQGAPEDSSRLVEGRLVHIFGQLREHDEKKTILILNISVVEDWNELTHHLLEVTLNHLQNTKGPIPGSAMATSMKSGMGMGMSTPSFNGMGGSVFNAGMGGMRQPNFGQTSISNQDMDVGRKVLEVYKMHSDSETGLSFQDALHILNQQGSSLSLNDLRKFVDNLSSEGQLYTTIDEMHYKSTD